MHGAKLEALKKFLSLIGADVSKIGGMAVKGAKAVGEEFPRASAAAGGAGTALLLSKILGESEEDDRYERYY